MDSYPWHRQAAWEWARQHWRCSYLNVLKHFLQMVDVNIVRQTGRVEEVVVKCRLLDVHIPTWRADFVHICWWRASISTVLACRALLLPPLPFTCTVSEEGMFISHSLVGGWPPKQHHFPVCICDSSACLCFHPSETAFHRETSCLSMRRREQDGDVQQNPNGVLHGCCLFRLPGVSLDRLSTKSAKCAHSSSGTSLSVGSNDFQHSDRLCSVCGEGRGARCCLALLWEEQPLFGDALADRLRDSGTQETHTGLSGWWHSAITISEGSTERLFLENACFRTTDRKQPLRAFHSKGRVKVWQLLLLSDEDDADGYWKMIDMHDSAEEGEDADKRVENNQKIFFCFLVFIFLFVLRMRLRESFGDFIVRIICVSQEVFRCSVKGRVSLFSVSWISRIYLTKSNSLTKAICSQKHRQVDLVQRLSRCYFVTFLFFSCDRDEGQHIYSPYVDNSHVSYSLFVRDKIPFWFILFLAKREDFQYHLIKKKKKKNYLVVFSGNDFFISYCVRLQWIDESVSKQHTFSKTKLLFEMRFVKKGSSIQHILALKKKNFFCLFRKKISF